MTPVAKLKNPVMLTPDGQFVEITEETFAAMLDFKSKKRTGSVEIQFRDGGIAGVEATYKKSYARHKSDE